MLNETHTPQGGMHRAGWILLTGGNLRDNRDGKGCKDLWQLG